MSHRAVAGRSDVVSDVRRTVDESPVYHWFVRIGFISRGVTYGVIGALTLALALGAGTDGAKPDQEGALSLIARSTIGQLALIIIAAGLFAYAVWKLELATFRRGPEGAGGRSLKDRAVNFAGGIAYIGFLAVALRSLIESGNESSDSARHAASGVLGWPGGPVIVGVAGVALLAVTGVQIYLAARARFLGDLKTETMDAEECRLVTIIGRIGLTARALVFGLIGYFLLVTAIDYNAHESVGVDGALARLHSEPYGAWLVGATAIGLLVFAAYSLFEARYRRL